MIRNPDDKELKYFQFFFGPAVWIIQDGKKSSPMLIFLSEDRPLDIPGRIPDIIYIYDSGPRFILKMIS